MINVPIVLPDSSIVPTSALSLIAALHFNVIYHLYLSDLAMASPAVPENRIDQQNNNYTYSKDEFGL